MAVGIEAINVYGGSAYLHVKEIFEGRGLAFDRFDNLMMVEKAVGLPCEDPVTNAVNAAKPIVDSLKEEDKNSIELLIVSTESGLDFGKSISTYIHDYLGLNKHCRLFEVKQACFGGTAAFQTGICFVSSAASLGARALVIATDTARAQCKKTYAEPTQATGAVAMLLSNKPDIFEIDLGATGNYSYEVMDTCRPLPEIELGDADLSLLSYLDCFENAYKHYESKVEGADFRNTFDYLAFHTPFAGMVKGAHRKLMRNFRELSMKDIAADFNRRVRPSLTFCQQIGNVYSATVYVALCGIIDTEPLEECKRVGIFSYGSGCASEFFSGLISRNSKEKLAKMKIGEKLASRHKLTFEEYEQIVDSNVEWVFGVQNKVADISEYEYIYNKCFNGKGMLVLDKVEDFHRIYRWS